MNTEQIQAISGMVFQNLMTANGHEVSTDDQRLRMAGLYPRWSLRDFAVGEVCSAQGQIWECYQAFSAAAYPQVAPDNPAFRTFFRPLHGKYVSTAREFVQPQGAYDIYKAGEYIWFNDRVYLCKADTVYSPTEYGAAWEVQ